MSTDAAASPLHRRPSAIECAALADCVLHIVQRNVLMQDVSRQRGNNYLEHMAGDVPHVLGFAFEPASSAKGARKH
ncbi:MAG: DUF3141 domain-containing protein [Xanthobacteraceae bacterium]|nr:DUF3141 domain-containing protein [Xanthobacteraceae bacterium]